MTDIEKWFDEARTRANKIPCDATQAIKFIVHFDLWSGSIVV